MRRAPDWKKLRIGGTLSADLSSLVNDADADATNELNTGVTLNGTNLEVTDSGGQWHPAVAEIAGDTVVVTAAQVSQPTAVRYAWRRHPAEANLYNRDGFLALPFNSSEQ